MGVIGYSAYLGGIGDSVHAAEVLRRLPSFSDVMAVIGIASFAEQFLPEIRKKGVDIHVMTVGSNAGLFARLRMEFFMLKHLTKARPDVIYTRFRSFCLGPLIASLLLQRHLCVEVNGLPALEYRRTLLNRIFFRLTRPVDRSLLKRGRVIVVDKEMLDRIKEYYGIDICGYHVPNGVNTDIFRPMKSDEARRVLGLHDGSIVLFVGAMEPWQGIENLIKAFMIVLEDVLDAHLYLVGDGSMLRHLRRRHASDRVHFTGPVSYRSVALYMNAADLCVVPIPMGRPNLPLKVLESLACGTAVVVTRNRATAELLSSCPDLLVPGNDPEVLASRMVSLLRDRERRERAARRGRQIVIRERSWETTVRKIVEICGLS